VIHGVARYYASRAQLSPDDGLYHIANTTGPDEQNVNVVDSAFGNCIAKMTLLAAHDLAASAGAAPNSTFKHIADKMFIPYDSELDYHPEYVHWNGTKHTFAHQFYTFKKRMFTKTDSGQTSGKLSNKRRFMQRALSVTVSP
jgi:trehalose/maltose hydrolase-like predicted phosphorylase